MHIDEHVNMPELAKGFPSAVMQISTSGKKKEFSVPKNQVQRHLEQDTPDYN